MTNDYRDYLQHHGVKGMKWGVRRRPELSDSRRNLNSLKSQRNAAKKRYNKDFNSMYGYANKHRLGVNFGKKQTNIINAPTKHTIQLKLLRKRIRNTRLLRSKEETISILQLGTFARILVSVPKYCITKEPKNELPSM